MAQFNSHLYYYSYQYFRNTATHLCILIQSFLRNIISPFLTTIWDHTSGCEKQYRCALSIYLLSCLALQFYIIIYRAVGAPRHGKDAVGGFNGRDKQMLKSSMENLLNPELTRYDPNCFQVHAGS